MDGRAWPSAFPGWERLVFPPKLLVIIHLSEGSKPDPHERFDDGTPEWTATSLISSPLPSKPVSSAAFSPRASPVWKRHGTPEFLFQGHKRDGLLMPTMARDPTPSAWRAVAVTRTLPHVRE